MTKNGNMVRKLTLDNKDDLKISVLIEGKVDDDGSTVICLAQQDVHGSVKQLSASASISVMCKCGEIYQKVL